MKKVELLAPAGNFDCLKAAINNGANAVYLGGKNFSARAYANNFDKDELISAIEYAHLNDVKIYVTLNPGASSVSEMTNQVSRFQWYKDGKWEDFYVGNSITKKEITTEMNETVRFRSIDINGNISKVS